ncbi:cGMP-specific 3',5'-cyclic phosphodiesterase-like isoform X2 [Panonychus citri]|uniref:cGMP-specific 3',5'-cyclic phosphodiesterase-like isoform X2 n=1 Tax=Panonychus citri TaxID=50023 RepID=UPI0023072E3D|nr:cGMP-specific 3',5'-cyclic phosphodiesterase-like isoform X2 [Panonychus citri]
MEGSEQSTLDGRQTVDNYLRQHPDYIKHWLTSNLKPVQLNQLISSLQADKVIKISTMDNGQALTDNNQVSSQQKRSLTLSSSSSSSSSIIKTVSSCEPLSPLSQNSNELLSRIGNDDKNNDVKEESGSNDDERKGVSGKVEVEDDKKGVDDDILAESYVEMTKQGRNSVTSELFQDIIEGTRKSHRPSLNINEADQLSRNELREQLRNLSEEDLLMELIRDISNELDINTLCHKILVNVCILINSDRGSLFLARGGREKRFLVPKLFDVTPNSIMEDALSAAEHYSKISPIPFGLGIAGHVAQHKDVVNLRNAYEDHRFNKEVDSVTGYRTKSILCLPILNGRGDVIGVAQCINKLPDGSWFSQQDVEDFKKYLTFCGIGIQNAQLFELSVQEYKRNQTSNRNCIKNCDDFMEIDNYDSSGNGSASTSLKGARAILSIPILNSSGIVIGVAQMINKTAGDLFTDVDISTLEAFSIFCGLGIHKTQMYEKAIKLMAKQKVALEVLSYHASSSIEETNNLTSMKVESVQYYGLDSFSFSDFNLSETDTCLATLRIFMELGLINRFQIPYKVLCRWLLSVKKNYRPVIYHNWRHSFNVTQTMYTILTTGGMEKIMNQLDILALIVACLCHDLDHRGTNNSFQSKIDSPLATLYSTSTMEHHHFDQCIMILNSEGNNILQALSPEEYKSVVSLIESCILSTDLAQYFNKRDKFKDLVSNKSTEWIGNNKTILAGMLMTACDVSAICKPWSIQCRIAQLVADEFFQQGDLEKNQLNSQPIAMMDRDRKHEFPVMQVTFIDTICLPIYSILSDCWPPLNPLYKGCLANRTRWFKIQSSVDKSDEDFDLSRQ